MIVALIIGILLQAYTVFLNWKSYKEHSKGSFRAYKIQIVTLAYYVLAAFIFNL